MRRTNILGYGFAALLAVGIGQSVASAQATSDPLPGEPLAGDPGAEPAPGLSKQVTLSPQEQLGAGNTYLANMETIRTSIRRDLEEAREQRDVVKTLCLNDKLNQIDVALRSAGERQRSLELAAGRGDKDLANHEFTILSVLHQRAQQLDAEAKQCIGKEVGFVGESSVTMNVDPNLPFDDPTDYPEMIHILEPPQCASCFR
jgi:hypothetical protein